MDFQVVVIKIKYRDHEKIFISNFIGGMLTCFCR